ncbi:MAG: hypothetical protein JRC92_09075 [Deltaproteobacteria bacterium]|nr:hypothetical protein [Deltaproteobacteria bacterium]
MTVKRKREAFMTGEETALKARPGDDREPGGNGCAGRFIRILKENVLWVRSFKTIEELRLTRHEFKDQYNSQWLIQKHGNKTPAHIRELQTASAEKAA